MNVASLVNPPRPDAPSPGALKLLRVEASVLAQAFLGSARESVLAFRFMRSLLLHGGATVPPASSGPAKRGVSETRALA
ncbi:hypothetical protein JRI60_09870 [Archangium violaceum]|uniref:hypothetical protein n=1 Tax=Archangium violaceum TaxID=83451 RepID=UPI0019505858|nr:hypothetical protein [Archangium violaceum]QRN99296.1 hypothetical protein JRI60_09870 [Archangium violaceum]